MARVREVRADLGRWWGMSRRVYVVDLLARTSEEYARRRGSTFAAALSYYVLFSFFPLLIFIVSVLGFAVRDPEAQEEITRTLLNTLPAGVDLQENIVNVVGEVKRTGHGLLGIAALLGTAWSASSMFTALRRALNSAFGVPEPRSFIRGKALDLARVVGVLVVLIVTLVAVFLVVFVVTAGLVLGQMLLPRQLIGVLPLDLAARLFVFALSYATSFAMMLLVYRLVPDRRLRVRDLWLGAALAGLGFEAAKFGFGLYLANFGRYEEVYGALGSGVAFLAFVFIVANVMLFVAVLTSLRLADRAATADGTAAA